MNLVANHRRDHRREAFVGHMHELRTRALVDEFAQQMLTVTDAAGAVMHLRPTAARDLEQLLKILRRHLRMNHHVVTARAHHQRHRHIIALYVERRFLHHQLVVASEFEV